MPATLRGIYHNLKESEYTVSNGEIILFFSSNFYRQKFLKEYKGYRERVINQINKLSEEATLNVETLADIALYKRIEKRGFRAWLKGIDISWQEITTYVLRKMIEKNTRDWSEIQKPKLEERREIMESI